MRDAVGGTFMIKLLLIFLAVYTVFIAIAINYAKAFKVKNKVINIIEQSEGVDYNDVSDASVIGQINTYMNDIHYGINTSSVEKNCIGYDYINTERGYCISKVENYDSSASYYRVTTFVTISVPIVRLEFTVPIKGETRKIERINT